MSEWTRHRIEIARDIIEQNQDTPMRLWAIDLSDALDEMERLQTVVRRLERAMMSAKETSKQAIAYVDHYRMELDKVYALKADWLKAQPPPPIVLKGDAAETFRLREENERLRTLNEAYEDILKKDAIKLQTKEL